MLMPSLFGENMLDDFFGRSFGGRTHELMSTDVKETEEGYEVIMNLPGFTKDNVKGELKDGYLTISANTSDSSETKDEGGKYIHRERYSGSCSRSFYVGESVKLEDIKARFEDGTLKLSIPKKDPQKAVEDKQYIMIEG